ncbi:MAG: nitrous oxide reductase family maturation protein NosD [bacterium]|nr:nitrous oxide reductase family maturation protein NosD [bacterium]
MKRIILLLLLAWLPLIVGTPVAGAQSFKDIKELESYIDSLTDFKKIVVTGHYKGLLTIRKPVHLVGKDAVFDGEGKSDVIIVAETASGTILEGLSIIDSGRSLYRYHCGIKVEEAKNLVIKNNRFKNNLTAIYLKKSHGSKVLNNESVGLARSLSVERAGDGIHLFASKNLLIKGNRMFEHRDGTYMEYSDKVDVIGNRYGRHLRYGLHYMYSVDNRFEDNIFEECGTGAAIMYTERVVLKRNIFRNIRGSRAYGILFKDARGLLLEENVFLENTIGLYLDNSHKNIIHNNLFVANGWAIDIFSSCHSNIIYGNAFIASTYEVSSDIRRTKNHFYHPEKKIGNYWDTYAGYDLDSDGLGDIPHNPVSFFGYLAKRYPDITVFAKSPVAAAIDYAERALPIVSTDGFKDKFPLIKWTPFKLEVEETKSFSFVFFVSCIGMILFSLMAVLKIVKR